MVGLVPLRTAIVAAVKRTPAGRLRAELTLGGRSVLAWQIDLACELGCERIVCICEAPGSEVLSLQKKVEGDGRDFHAIRTNLQLASLVRADDELIIFQDGLLVDREAAFAFANQTHAATLDRGIATIPAGHALALKYPEDYERIDRTHNWAGFAIMRATNAYKIAELPPDSATISLLLRLGLQARVVCREVSSKALEDGQWILATSEAALVERESALINSALEVPRWAGPGLALAFAVVRHLGARGLDKGESVSALAAMTLMLCGILLAGIGHAFWGILLCALGAFAGSLNGAWSELRAKLWLRKGTSRTAVALRSAVNLLSVVVLAIAIALGAEGLPQLALAPVFIGLAMVNGKDADKAISAFWRDRCTQLLVFAFAAAFDILGEALALFSLAALTQLMLRTRTM